MSNGASRPSPPWSGPAPEQHGSLGGENLSDRGILADGAFKNTVGTTLNTGVYAAGSGIESNLQDLMKDEKDE
jgi:hypothetical protein